MTKQQDSTTIAAVCGQCGIDSQLFLHHIRHRGVFRRLCTTCVLRANSQSFCPTCFVLYESRTASIVPRPQPDAVSCFKCYSNSHSSCVGPNPNKPYICPLCTTHVSPIFSIKNKVIDKKSATVLVTASKIAADSMSKASAGAKAEAEKRAREAAFTRKRAKEAMEYLACMDEKLLKKDSGSGGASGFGIHRSAFVNNIVGNVGGRNLFGHGIRMDRVDSSSGVLAAMNAVGLKEREKLQGVKLANALPGVNIGAMSMEVGGAVKNNGAGNEKKPGDSGRHVVPVLNVKPIAVLNVDQQKHYVQNHAREGNAGSRP